MTENYSQLDTYILIQQFKRLSQKMQLITLKKLQMVMDQYNNQRLDLANMIIQLDKRGLVNKLSDKQVQMIRIGVPKKNENSSESK